jgi:ribose transport system ATP-binding protein
VTVVVNALRTDAGVLLEATGIRKSFPGVLALAGVSLRLRAGEIHALLGENGAGKSTLIKVLTGVYHADEGQLLLGGEPANLGSPRAALAAGISVVHQERNLIPQFTVAENVMLDRLPTALPQIVDYRRIFREAQRWMERVGLLVPPDTRVADLSVAQMQLVEIAKALSLEARLLLLDEPTASITAHEVSYLFHLLRDLRDHGVALLFVSHKLEEVFDLCDRVTVLRDGRNACDGEDLRDLSTDRLVTYMVGRADVTRALPAKPEPGGEPVLELVDVDTEAGARNISLQLRRGEVLGLYGLIGAGRTELARAIVGEVKVTGGGIRRNGKSVRIRGVRDALERHRIGYLSENRKEEGLILLQSVGRNLSVTIWRRLRRLGLLIFGGRERDAVLPYVERLDIRAHSLAQSVGTLSGGNQQKVSLGKWLAADVEILIVDEPTVGIDIKTKNALHELLWELAAQGRSILLISSDMPEIVRVADRILVMREHRIVGEIANSHNYADVSEAIMGWLS